MTVCLLTLGLAGAMLLAPGGEGDLRVVGDERLALAFDTADGALREIRVGGRTVAREPAGQPSFDLQRGERWLRATDRLPVKLLDLTPEPDGATITVAGGEWEFRFVYRLESERRQLVRRVAVTWRGADETTIQGFWLRTPTMALAADGYYLTPGVWPPERRRVVDFRPGQRRNGTGVPPSVVTQLDPGLSAVWLADERTPHSDRNSVTVTEQEGGLLVSQAFQMRGRIRPGQTQTVGDLHLWFVPADGETALRSIHDWMARVGHVIPADRPDWFRDALLYSFHPGGTIGSQFRDLGGFKAATAFLDEIVDLGCNAIWLLPVEDRSPYHPRDYYRFQEGLGSPEEFRALVARAHELGLHVLQDIVPHGGSNTYPRALEHPEWLVQEPDGSTLSYWCFDFNWPTWLTYMGEVARHYVKEYGVDGYRVDAIAGSKIPNWNPAIPYDRASFAQLQGGLNMLRSLRAAVKAEKPAVGGLLAETGGSVYGTEADAIYDFTACYNVFHGARRQPPAQFAANLRRWLHEQQYAEARDLLRLRHLESHDSLRAGGWYGVDGHRAMFALQTWIHGLPMVYHEQETGNRTAFRRILGVRQALPELSRGVADYLSVEAPAGVFACLRSLDQQATLALINLNPEPVDGELSVPVAALPAALRGGFAWTDMLAGGTGRITVTGERARLECRLAPLGYTALALRVGQPVSALAPAAPWPAPATASAGPSDRLTLRGVGWEALLDEASGLPQRVTSGAEPLLAAFDLALDPATAAQLGPAAWRTEGETLVAERPAGQAALVLRYRARPDRLSLTATWRGPAPEYAALALPVNDATRWSAAASEGLLDDVYRPRHLTTDGVSGSIYWRPQGTAAIYDSLLQPLPPSGGVLAAAGRSQAISLRFVGDAPPARVQWLDRLGDDRRLTALLALRDGEAPVEGVTEVALELLPGRVEAPADGLRPAVGGWVWANRHYRLEIGRNGLLRRLGPAGGGLVAEKHDLYTDGGFAADRSRFGAENDVEAAVRLWRENGVTRLRAEGRLRGFQRFDKLNPPLAYRVEYTLADGPSFRLAAAVHPSAAPRGEFAFLAQSLVLPELTRLELRRAGRSLAVGDALAGARVAQSRELAELPDEVLLSGAGGPLLRLTGLTCGGPDRPNIFAHGTQFFVAFEDGPPRAMEPAWHWCDAVWTVGPMAPAPLGAPPVFAPAGATGRLADPGFELAGGAQLRLVRGGVLPRVATASAWQPPSGGGRLVAEPVHGGRVAAEVTGEAGSYRLWRQSLRVGDFPPGSRWRLAAWAKGQDIARGAIDWQVPVVRFAVTTDRTTYVSASPPMGSFDWRPVAVEWTAPEGVTGLEIQLGQNGSTGLLWLDDVTLERLD